jgi:4-amino-4-deoxy-L-arabinose transferase-like glycosyltransferase
MITTGEQSSELGGTVTAGSAAESRDLATPVAAGNPGSPRPVSGRGRGLGPPLGRLEWLGVAGLLLLSLCFNVYRLDTEGYGNTYYAAAVKSMAQSWHNFFFAAFDPGGFISVDKPPLGLWLQVASVKLFGFHGLSLLLPQALAGMLSVGLLYLLVRRAFGVLAGLLAGLALAVTPISVVTDRNNTMDALLVLIVLLGAWTAFKAAEGGRLRWLLLCATLVGLGFNVKMLQAYLVVPAFWLLYLLGAPLRRRTRLWHLAVATLVLLAVSLSWAVAVDLTPAGARPYVGSSGSNSELSLILGYNGLGRITHALPAAVRRLPFLDIPIDLDVAPGFAPGIGSAGPLRLLNQGLAGQLGWLLLPAVLGLVVGLAGLRHRRPLNRQGQALVLWGGWLAVAGGYFSFARFFHPYYLVMLAPPVAALTGIGLRLLWREYRRSSRLGLLLPAALVAAALVQAHILAPYPDWSRWLRPLVLTVCLLAAAALLGGWLLRRPGGRLLVATTAVGALVLLVAPATWAAISVQNGAGGAWIPQAGPSQGFGFPGPGGGPPGPPLRSGPAARGVVPGMGGPVGGPPSFGTARQGAAPGGPGGGPTPRGGPGFGGGGAMTFSGAGWDVLDPGLVRYLEAQQGSTRDLVATPTSSYASLFILATGRPVLALGGYQGWDRILTPAQLAAMVADGTLRFFYLPSGGGGSFGPGAPADASATTDLADWVQAACSAVPATAWQTTTAAGQSTGGSGQRGPGGAQQLYDCAATVQAT